MSLFRQETENCSRILAGRYKEKKHQEQNWNKESIIRKTTSEPKTADRISTRKR